MSGNNAIVRGDRPCTFFLLILYLPALVFTPFDLYTNWQRLRIFSSPSSVSVSTECSGMFWGDFDVACIEFFSGSTDCLCSFQTLIYFSRSVC